MENLATRLLSQEVITLPDLIEVLGERPFPMKESLREYLTELNKWKEETPEDLANEKKAEELKPETESEDEEKNKEKKEEKKEEKKDDEK
jgi:uncharacterized membrane protein YukC